MSENEKPAPASDETRRAETAAGHEKPIPRPAMSVPEKPAPGPVLSRQEVIRAVGAIQDPGWPLAGGYQDVILAHDAALREEVAKTRFALKRTAEEAREWVRMVTRWARDPKNFDRDAVWSACDQCDKYLTEVLNELRGER